MEKNINKKINNSQNLERGNSKENKKGFNFKQTKKNTIKSLTEVESFLRDFKKLSNYIKLYKIMK